MDLASLVQAQRSLLFHLKLVPHQRQYSTDEVQTSSIRDKTDVRLISQTQSSDPGLASSGYGFAGCTQEFSIAGAMSWMLSFDSPAWSDTTIAARFNYRTSFVFRSLISQALRFVSINPPLACICFGRVWHFIVFSGHRRVRRQSTQQSIEQISGSKPCNPCHF